MTDQFSQEDHSFNIIEARSILKEIEDIANKRDLLGAAMNTLLLVGECKKLYFNLMREYEDQSK